jgi:hypothetical protein
MRRSAPKPVLLLCLGLAACATYQPDEPSADSPSGGHAGQTSASAGHAGSVPGSAGAKGGTGGDGSAGASHGGDSSGSAGTPAHAGSAAGGVSNGGSPTTGGAASAGSPSTAGSAGASSVCAAPTVAPGTKPLIDDFNHLGRAIPGNEGRNGVWDVWSLSAAADMFPKSASYQTTGADVGDGYTHWTGKNIGGLNDWGPTLTVQLAGGCPYDASVYSGVSLKLKGNAVKKMGAVEQPLQLKVMLWQPPAVPAKDAKGGTCVAAACYNHFSAFVNIPADWDAPVVLPFASLVQGSWTGTAPFAWNPKQLLAIQFQVEVDGSKSELTTFDLSLDDLAFVK